MPARLALLLLLLALLAARSCAPSDLWDQTQPRTIAYTVDMVVHGGSAWILPLDGEGVPATKPPLYNWIAAPFVAIFGRDCELAHKMPGVLALAALCVLVAIAGRSVRVGPSSMRRDASDDGQIVGLLAAAMLLGSPAIFKLGYLARPDMLLVFWLALAWWAATRLIVGPRPRSVTAWRLAFWGAVVAAAWTKGPPALLPIVFALVLARMVQGRFGALRELGAVWAVPSIALACGWPLAAYTIDPGHVVDQLWGNEFAGRVTGAGPEGGGRGAIEIVTGLPKMPLYFIARFAPWSIVAIVAMVALLGPVRSRRPRDPTWPVVCSAATWTVLTLVLFSFSSGKRADYIAPAFPAAAILAAWWVCDAIGARRGTRPVFAGAATLVALMAVLQAIHSPLPRGVQRAIDQVVVRARAAVDAGEHVLALRTPAEQVPAIATSGRPSASSVANVATQLEVGFDGTLIYTEEWIPLDLRARVEQLEREGLALRAWRVEMPWKEEDPPPRRTVVGMWFWPPTDTR